MIFLDIKSRIAQRIDADDNFASQLEQALDTNDTSWLAQLIYEVIGIVIQIGSDIWNWLCSL
ncbi:hypothetical protein LC613_03760 [Nostoc sphaeroides CHAB 2801]|uniref:hypothetical protein n=1 Tax=Nostoc sphaeroides TaxID=446679 RepID=UPI000E52EEE7|nr:hypothetical protein [Nostoc sphaeroides]MCC5627325.1 hypothetical protein [Nostoc sphaeroides CHAB 2801]